jgi:cytochrome c553
MHSATTRWGAAALVLGAAVVLLAPGCGASPPPGSPEALYVRLGCARCHGNELEGTRTAPPLENLSAHWTEDELVAYLKNPAAFRGSKQHVQALAERYAVDMTATVGATDDELRRVAGWVLGGG